MGEQSEPEEAAQEMAFKQVFFTNVYLISIFWHVVKHNFSKILILTFLIEVTIQCITCVCTFLSPHVHEICVQCQVFTLV